MTSKRLFYSLIATLLLIIAGTGAVLYYGNKQLTQQNNKLSALKLESNSLDQVQASLNGVKKDIAKYTEIEQIARTVVPQEKDQARTVREIVKLADESRVAVASINFPTSSLGSDAKSSKSTKDSAGATSQTTKVEGLTNVEQLQITVDSDKAKPTTYTSLLIFLEKLEQNRRTSQVTSVNIQPDSENRNLLTFTLTLNVYIKK